MLQNSNTVPPACDEDRGKAGDTRDVPAAATEPGGGHDLPRLVLPILPSGWCLLSQTAHRPISGYVAAICHQVLIECDHVGDSLPRLVMKEKGPG